MVLDYQKIGRRLRKRRRMLGMTQEKLAKEIDVCASYVGLIERGKRIPSLETMVKLCRALRVRIDRMVD